MLYVDKYSFKLFMYFVIVKISMEYYYYSYYVGLDYPIYVVDLNIWKYIYGSVWVTILFFGIRHSFRIPSTFLMQFFYMMQVIPMTVIFAFQNESWIFYTTVCVSVLAGEIILARCKFKYVYSLELSHIWWTGIAVFGILILFLFVVRLNGLPTTKALDFDAVYDLRSSGFFKSNQYTSYLLSVVSKCLLPLVLAYSLWKRKYLPALIAVILESVLYLYTGMKEFLFVGPMVVIVTLWGKRDWFYKGIWYLASVGLAFLSFGWRLGNLVYYTGSLLVRRCMLLPAIISFKYYDYFRTNPRVGLSGIYPRWLVPSLHNEYLAKDYSYIISDLYFHEPQMQSNNGIFGEACARFGLWGILLEVILMILIFMMVDVLMSKTSYAFALGASVFFAYGMINAHLIDQLLCGYWAALIVFYLFYNHQHLETTCVVYEKTD